MINAETSRRDFLKYGFAIITVGTLRNVNLSYAESSSIPDSQSASEPQDQTAPIEISLSNEMQERASTEFDDMYKEFKELFIIDAGEGKIRTIYDMDLNNTRTAMEYQASAALFALHAEDFETAEKIFKFDDQFKTSDGLTPWLIGNDGSVEDETVVSAVMMHLAAARLLSPDESRQAEGKEMLKSLIDNKVIRPDIHIPQAFHWPGSYDYTNPSYWSPYLLEQFAGVDPYWLEVEKATRDYMGRIDAKIDSGEYAFFPKWTNMEAEVQVGPSGEPIVIDYDAAWFVVQQALGAIYSQDQTIKSDAIKQLSYADRFFYEKIVVKNAADEVIDYDITRLLDEYNLDGTPTENAEWPLTAWASAASLASIASRDENYRNYMFEQLLNMPHPTGNMFNDLIRDFTLLTLSGRFGETS